MRTLCFGTDREYTVDLNNFNSISKNMHQKKTKTKENLHRLRSPIGELCRKELLDKIIEKVEIEMLNVIYKLHAHHKFYLLKNCFSKSKLLYFLRTSSSFLRTLKKKTKKLVMRGHKCEKDDHQFFPAVLPAAKGGLGVSSARLLYFLIFSRS